MLHNQSQPRTHTIRNLMLFTVAALGSGWLGVALDRAIHTPNPQQGLGILLWLLMPAGTGLLLRAFGGDGWQDAGLRPNLRSGWMWYLAALLIFPLVSLLTFGLGSIVGALSVPEATPQGLGAFVLLVVVSFAALFVKNICEEVAWRGYLTARFDAAKFPAFINHLLTGLIWGCWHIPYWLYFVDVQQGTALGTFTFIVLGICTLVITAITYGELRLVSTSVWPAVVLHSVANAVTAALPLSGLMKRNGWMGGVFSPGNDGIIHAIIFALIGIGLYSYRMKHTLRP